MNHESPWMFRYTVALALCVFGVIILGASVTTEIQPVPGPAASLMSALTPTQAWLERAHVAAAIFLGVLTLGLGLWLQRAKDRAGLRRLGWAALAVVVIEGWPAIQGSHTMLPRGSGFLHASLAPILLSIIAAIAIGTSNEQERGQLLEDPGRPSFRTLAVVVPLWLLLQVLLGAAFRHGLLGVLWHILNALLVTILVLVVCILLIRQFPNHPSLRPAALALAIVTGVQVALGFATFITLLIGPANPIPLLILSVAHVAIGAVTLAASVVLAIQIRQNLSPAVGQS